MTSRGTLRTLLSMLISFGLSAQSLQITRQQQMDFGSLIAEPAGGSITLTPESQLVPGPNRRVRPFLEASPRGAMFRITGPPGRRISVAVDPPSPAFASRLRISEFRLGLPSSDCQLNAQGYLDLQLGATLDVSAGNQSGPFLQNSVRLVVRDRDASSKSKDPDTLTAACPIRVVLRAPLSIERRQDLSFGDILLRPEGGQLCVEPGGRYFWKDQRRPEFLRTKPRTALFLVSGSTDAQIEVRIPTGSIYLKNVAGHTVRLKDFTTDVDRSIRLPDAGPLSFEVGATLELAPNQAPGAYQGTFQVSVNYL